jgi:hypothetical protein
MQEAFGVVLFVVVAVSALAAVVALVHTGRTYDDIGKGGLFEDGGTRASGTPDAVRDDEIRQMLGARNARRTARGEAAVDVEDELAALTRPAADPGLEAEIRELVESRNRRRAARGQAPLDVEAEVARRLQDLGPGG